jgi:predicted nuclease of restriction endonuclease-like (RecB) superfamily
VLGHFICCGLSPSAEGPEIGQTVSGQLATVGRPEFRLPWSHYVRLMAVKEEAARRFYQTEALRGGWSVRQLDRQIATVFYEHTAVSRDKSAMLTKGAKPRPEDQVSAEEEVKDPLVLEFLNLKDEYSESDLEEALLRHLEKFLLELGGNFAFVGRQRRLRIGDEWYRVDLLFFHRKLRFLVVIDLLCGRPHNKSSVAEDIMWRWGSRRSGIPRPGAIRRNINARYRARRNCMRPGSSRQRLREALDSTAQSARALAFISRSASA